MRRAIALLLFSALVWPAASGCAATDLAPEREDAFNQGVEALGADDPVLSLRATWRYLKGASEDDPRYDRALRILARAAERLDLRYAASIWYLAIAQARRDAELIPDAIAGLERIVMGGPHDRHLLVEGFLAAEDPGPLPPALSSFVNFHAGLDSLRRGYATWADARFAQIDPLSPYAWRARYVRAVQQVARGELDAAQAAFEVVLAEADDDQRVDLPPLPDDLRVDLERTLARLHFEAGRFAFAILHYDRIRERASDDPALLLEMAWAHFYLGHTRRALGLVLALDAPEFSDLIAPERFLLEALCLRRLCQFDPARQAAVRLEARYADAYRDLYSGIRLTDSEALESAARRRREVRPLARFRASLERERARISQLAPRLEPELRAGLERIYGRGLEEAERREAEALRVSVEAVAEQLLSAQEGVRLVTHELSVALLRGRRRPDDAPADPDAGRELAREGVVAFAFDGEYWTDELDDLVVRVEDRCIE